MAKKKQIENLEDNTESHRLPESVKRIMKDMGVSGPIVKTITMSREEFDGNFGSIGLNEFDEYDEDDEDDDTKSEHGSNGYTIEISFVEFAIINGFLFDQFKRKDETHIKVSSYGNVDGLGRVSFGGEFEITGSYFFNCNLSQDDKNYIIQTKMFIDQRGDLCIQLHISSTERMVNEKFEAFIKKLKGLSFNHSEYKGKVIKVKMKEGRFKGIEKVDIEEAANELILNELQNRHIQHIISRISRGGSARYLLNGEPGTGKTESIREICRKLTPNVTFIIPEFEYTSDLTTIMEACEIFENAVIIMDDIDLFLGSRDNGSYTKLLGQFLSFFDGVKKRKISLLASTNDKGLVDKAAERPGRFNFTLDYTFLNDEQIIKVCEIHLPEKWRVQEVYDALTGKINEKKANITGAFIANLAENIIEMSEDDPKWSIEDTVSLIKESYRGFYASQVEKEKTSSGFQIK
jgi:DNA polymerase III delta prime subunit